MESLSTHIYLAPTKARATVLTLACACKLLVDNRSCAKASGVFDSEREDGAIDGIETRPIPDQYRTPVLHIWPCLDTHHVRALRELA